MNENFNKTFSELFKNTDVNALKEKIPMILSMLNTPDGQELMAKLKNASPEALSNLMRSAGKAPKKNVNLDDVLNNASPDSIRKMIDTLDQSK